jgi:hypothetical protein
MGCILLYIYLELSEEEKYQTKINDLKNSLANIERNNSENVKRLVDEKDQCVKVSFLNSKCQ